MKFVAFGVVLLLLASCKKENSDRWTTVNIHSVSAYTGDPVDDIYFAVRGIKNASEKTDWHGNFEPENGMVRYSFKAKANFDYSIYFPPNTDQYNVGIEGGPFEVGKENNLIYRFVEYGHLAVSIENIDCEWDDEFHWRLSYLELPSKYVKDNYWEDLVWDGCYGLEEVFNQPTPSGHYLFEWTLKEVDGSESFGSESVFVPENGNAILDFTY